MNAINRDFLALKIENCQLKIFDVFLIFAQNIDCGHRLEAPRRGGSNECPQSTCMFWRKIRNTGTHPCIPQFYYIKVGYKIVFISRTCFPDVKLLRPVQGGHIHMHRGTRDSHTI